MFDRVKDFFSTPDERLRSAVEKVPLVSIAGATDGAVVRVAGKVVAGDGETIAPFSGRSTDKPSG